MPVTVPYDRERAVLYAGHWAFGRNPLFENYAGIGGDCTSFVSQAIYAGSCAMNYTPTFGWYYVSPTDRAPAWTGVQYLYNFLTKNEGAGPYAVETYAGGLLEGDVIQLGRADGAFYHSLLVTGFAEDGYLVSAHSNDAYNRPLSTYVYDRARFLHIEGVRRESAGRRRRDCFAAFLAGERI